MSINKNNLNNSTSNSIKNQMNNNSLNNNNYQNTNAINPNKINDNLFYFKNNPFGKIIHNINFYEIEKFNNSTLNTNFFNFNDIENIVYNDLLSLPYNKDINDTSNITQFHWGQRKLLLSELQFFNHINKTLKAKTTKKYTIIYIGAAPGNHIKILLELFDNLNFILIDSRKFNKNIIQEANNKTKSSRYIKIMKELLTVDGATKLREKLIANGEEPIVISDIRNNISYPTNIFKNKSDALSKTDKSSILEHTGNFSNNLDRNDIHNFNPELYDEGEVDKVLIEYIKKHKPSNTTNLKKYNSLKEKFEDMYLFLWNDVIIQDMNLQKQFIEILKPKEALLKFRFPYYLNKHFEYFDGHVFLPVYGPKFTTECRLLVSREGDSYSYKKWNPLDHEKKLNYFNHVTRKQYYYHNHDNISGICHCYDCSCEINIIKNYLALYPKTKILPNHKKYNSSIKEYINKFTNYINDNNQVKINLLHKYISNIQYSWANNKDEIREHIIKLSTFLIKYEPFYRYILQNKIYRFSDNKEWYYHNKVGFIKWIKSLFKKEVLQKDIYDDYKIQQRLVSVYLQHTSPYRGLLLYHGLGTGKTITSISISEILINHKDIIVMLPASLKSNYIDELMRMGHHLYTKENNWKFFNIDEINYSMFSNFIDKEYVEKNKGLWLPYSQIDEVNNAMIGGASKNSSTSVNLSNIVENNNDDNDVHIEEVEENGKEEKKPHVENKSSSIQLTNSSGNKENNIKSSIELTNSGTLKVSSNSSLSSNVSENKIVDKKFNIRVEINRLFNKNDFKDFKDLTDNQQNNLLEQLRYMVNKRYQFIKYNGLQEKTLNDILWTKNSDGKVINAFDNKVIIIDEVHNFISRTLGSGKIGYKVYEQILTANNCKIVLLSGTPIINKPFESALLINLIKGYTKLHIVKYNTYKNYNSEDIKKLVLSYNKIAYVVDVDIKDQTLKFITTPNDFVLNENGLYEFVNNEIYNEIIINKLHGKLESHDIELKLDSYVSYDKLPLPNNEDDFNQKFIDEHNNKIIHDNVLFKHFTGAISFYENTDKTIFPDIKEIFDEKLEMSDLQFTEYSKVRKTEIEKEKKARLAAQKYGRGNSESSNNVFRTFSKAVCNFVFPKTLIRPYPSTTKSGKDVIDDIDKKIIEKNPDLNNADADAMDEVNASGMFGGAKGDDAKKVEEYKKQLLDVLNNLISNKKYLDIEGELPKLSPKYTKIIQNLNKTEGKTLIYSFFRTVEGIGLLGSAMENNGMAEIGIEYKNGIWKFNTGNGEYNVFDKKYDGKRFFKFPLDKEEARIMLDIFNDNYDKIPSELREELKTKFKLSDTKKKHNLHGNLIRTIMITQAGSEGISLMATRHVHILEPYWNNIRIDQVIGRARRLNSHIDLPQNERNVTVFKYTVKFSDTQLKEANKSELKFADNLLTTDEAIVNIANRKETLNNTILDLFKRSSIDCGVYNDIKGIDCYNPSDKNNSLLNIYNIDYQVKMNIGDKKTKTITQIPLKQIEIKEKKYFIGPENIVYIKENGELISFGKLSKKKNGTLFIKKLK